VKIPPRTLIILLISCTAGFSATKQNMVPEAVNVTLPSFSFQYRSLERNAFEYDDVWHVPSAKHGRISIEEIRGSISFDLYESLYFDIIFGGSSWKTEDFDYRTYNHDFDYSWLWGIGVRQYLLWALEDYKIHLLFSFDYTVTSKQTAGNLEGELEQWNISGIWLIPVEETWICSAGIYYSDFDMRYWHSSVIGKRRGGFGAEDNTGVLFGVQKFLDKNVCLWSIVYLLAQEGITFGINWSF
jgi:hypothetical protein